MGYTQQIHIRKIPASQEKSGFSYNTGCIFPQIYTHPVEKYFSHTPQPQISFPQIIRILTGSCSDFSKAFPHRSRKNFPAFPVCGQDLGCQQVSLPQKHSFPAAGRAKNPAIPVKNRLSTNPQDPTAAATTIFPYSYLTLSCSLARTKPGQTGSSVENRIVRSETPGISIKIG